MCIFRFFIIVVTLSINPLSFAMLRMQRMPILKVGATRIRSYSNQLPRLSCGLCCSLPDCTSNLPRSSCSSFRGCSLLVCKQSLSHALSALSLCHKQLHDPNPYFDSHCYNGRLTEHYFVQARKIARCDTNREKIAQHILEKHFYDKNSSILSAEILHLNNEIDLLKQETTAFSKEEGLVQEKKVQKHKEKDRERKERILRQLKEINVPL